MSGPRDLSEQDMHAFIDGELPAARTLEVTRILALDADLAARVLAFRHDRDRLAAAVAPAASASLPDAWLKRIEAAVGTPAASAAPPASLQTHAGAVIIPFRPKPAPRRPVFAWAAAACLALILGVAASQLRLGGVGDTILADAQRAGRGALPAAAHFAGATLPPPAALRDILSKATGLPVRAPDLRRLGWRLVSVDTYAGAAALHYVHAQAGDLSVYVRKSTGAPRFDILRQGDTRICLWQDEVVGAVMMGKMTAGQMMRVAGAAYADLDL